MNKREYFMNNIGAPGRVEGGGIPLRLQPLETSTFSLFTGALASLKNGAHQTSQYIRKHVPEEVKLFAYTLLTGTIVSASIVSGNPLTVLTASVGLIVGGAGLSMMVQVFLDKLAKAAESKAMVPQEELQQAIQSGNPPKKFEDPIFYNVMQEPIIYAEDPSQTVYDRVDMEQLKKIDRYHPALRIPFNELTEVP